MSTSLFLLILGGTILALLLAALVMVLLLAVPWQAYRRGHGFFAWFVLQVAAMNPVYPLVLVALLPDRAKSRLRDQFARELDARLGGVAGPQRAPVVPGATPDRSIGDRPTADGSVGDRPTDAGEGRSVGDVETRDTEG